MCLYYKYHLRTVNKQLTDELVLYARLIPGVNGKGGTDINISSYS